MKPISFPFRKLILFALLSGADYLLTQHLVARVGSSVYESNPVAAWYLSNFGWLGLAAFKASAVVIVLLAVVGVYQRRPRSAHRLLTFACVAVAGVVLYSMQLARAVGAEWPTVPAQAVLLPRVANPLAHP